MEQLLKKTEKAEADVALLYQRIDNLKSGNYSTDAEAMDEESRELIIKNQKLKYRIGILKRAIEEEKENSKRCKGILESDFNGLKDNLTVICMKALKTAYPDVDVQQEVQPSGRPQFGDYQFNAAMHLCKMLKTEGVKCSPPEIAKNIVSHIESSTLIDKIEVAPAGFINLWLNKEFCQNQLTKLVAEGVKPPTLKKKLRVGVDFSSPNIAKEMHVGHLRSTIIGDSICRLLEYLGHDVLRLNHVGDWGTQFGMLIAHLQDKFPDYLKISPPIADLQNFYKESKVRFDNDEEFKKRAYHCVVKLQQREPDYITAWNLICDVSRKEFQVIYDKLDIEIIERGESFYQKHMEALVKDLDEKGLLIEDEGRKVIFGTEKGSIPLTIVKSDGGFTYDTSDLATVKQRVQEDNLDWIIYVTDAGQATHFKLVYNVAKKLGLWDPKKVRMDHVQFGLVLGSDKKKFKTRSGETIKLSELLEEGLNRAEQKLKEKERDSVLSEEEFQKAKEAVAYGCIKYADLCHNRINDYVFSFDKMLDDKGNTAVYMLYALTRIRSIARNANISVSQLQEAAKDVKVSVEHEKEWNLAKILLRFNEELKKIVNDLHCHHLCEFLYDIATAFTEFYGACYCIEKDPKTGNIVKVHMGRLLLCEATAMIMEKCFHLLGLKSLSRM
ncbi:arginine--tRNA ligase-like protein isoform X1 [Rhodnius prolixus]|uniref:arginine--tRNA ligase-like protein isoform X1 n=1 Tax=Rhodnius prolixus TaxID=13249 RepID=UPI003D188FC2